MSAIRVVTAVLVGCVACTNLPDLTDRCGNGVIDQGEDCDDSSARCDHCGLRCNDDGSCGADLPGYQCGVDRFCHAPSGVFTKHDVDAFTFAVGAGRVVDMDGDGIGDVVGLSDSQMEIHFGEPSGHLTVSDSLLVPVPKGQPAFRSLGAGKFDIVLPTQDGIAAFTSQNKLALPYPFANAPGRRSDCVSMNGKGSPIALMNLDSKHFGSFSRGLDGTVYLGMTDAATNACAYVPACNLVMPSAPDPTMIATDVYETAAGGTLVTLTTDQGACTMRAINAPSGPDPFTITEVKLVPTTGPAILARTGTGSLADPCPSLFVKTSAFMMYRGVIAGGFCGLAPTPVTVNIAITNRQLVGRIPLVPAITGRGPDAVVVTTVTGLTGVSDVFALDAAVATPIYQLDRPLRGVVSTDLDGNGSIEALGLSQFGGIDVLYWTAATFLPYRIATAGVPLRIVVGDFDGNTIGDFAYVEQLGNDDQRLMVSYGTTDRPLPAVEVTSFHDVQALFAMDIPDSTDRMGGLLTDIAVVDLTGQMAAAVTVLHGSPQRVMLAYYDPRTEDLQTRPSEFAGVVAGNFDGNSDAQDLILLERQNASGMATLYQVSGSTGEALSDDAPCAMPGCPTPSAITQSGAQCQGQLCAQSARYLAWPITDGTTKRDVVIAIDANTQRDLVTLDPNVPTMLRSSAALVPLLAVHDPNMQTVSMFGADLDGDGLAELVMSFVPTIQGTFIPTWHGSVVLACDVSPAGDVVSCGDIRLLAPSDLMDWTCSDAVPATVADLGRRAAPAPVQANGLVLSCHKDDATGSLLHFFHDSTGYHATVIVEQAPNIILLGAGDVTGDRVDDLAGVSFEPLPTIHMFLQCEARDTACRQANQP